MGLLIKLVFLAIPENLLQIYAGLALQGRHISLRRLLGSATVVAVLLQLIRQIPGPFGFHVPLHALILILFLRFLGPLTWPRAIIGALVVQLLIAIGEGLVAFPVMSYLSLSLADALAQPFINVGLGWLADSLLIALSLYLYFRQRSAKMGASDGR